MCGGVAEGRTAICGKGGVVEKTSGRRAGGLGCGSGRNLDGSCAQWAIWQDGLKMARGPWPDVWGENGELERQNVPWDLLGFVIYLSRAV